MTTISKPWMTVGLVVAAAAAQAQPVTELSPVDIVSTPDRPYVAPNASSGTKTDTPIMETPLNIQVVPQQVLQDQKITTLEQALKNVSGVKASSNYGLQEQIFLRGFSTQTTFRNGFRIDDALGNGVRAMTNVDSVEVLKGPAAILYGRVEPGGAVNVVTKQPQATPYYSLEQSVGSWGHYLTNFDATGPVNQDKTLLYRVNASYDKSKSWRDGVTNERLFIAPTLQLKVSPQTTVTLEAEYNHNPYSYDVTALPYDPVSNQFVQLPRNKNLAAGAPIPTDTPVLGLTWSHQFNDDWTIKNQITRHDVKSKYDPWYAIGGFTQLDPSSWTVDRMRSFGDGRSTTTATVLDLTGHFDTAGLKHTLLMGADYYRWNTSILYGYSSTLSTTDAFNPAPPTGLVIDTTTLTKYQSSTDNYGVYLQDQIKLPNNVQVLAGLRHQKVANTSSSIDVTTDVLTPNDPQSDTATTPRVGLLWQPQSWLSLYGNYAENFGANTGRDWQNEALRPESAQQKELGVKAEFLGGKLRTSLAYFDLTKQNVATSDPAHLGFQIAVGEIRSKGTELDIQGEIQRGWNVIATYAHTDARITKSNNGDEGLRKGDVPKDMASLWTTYEFSQTQLPGWKVGGGATWRSSTTDATNTIDTPGYTLVDVMTSYEFKAGRKKVTAQLNINNLFDKSYFTDAMVYGNLGYMQFGAPRAATASLKVEF
jgi:iron complex outermembrane receptor protein